MIPAFDDDLPLSGETFAATAASKSASLAAASWVCSVYASDPTKFANTIEGEGFQSCAGAGWGPQRLKVTIQRYLGLGAWQNKASIDSGNVWIDFVQRDRIYNCAGTGSQQYRVISDGWAVNGAYHLAVQSANYLRVTC